MLYKKIGTWTSWHLNGQKKEKGAYINGQKNGIWVEWYENGEKKSEGQYVENNKHFGFLRIPPFEDRCVEIRPIGRYEGRRGSVTKSTGTHFEKQVMGP